MKVKRGTSRSDLTITNRELGSINFVVGTITVQMSLGYMVEDDGWRQFRNQDSTL